MSTEIKQLELELKKRLLIVEVGENDLEDFSKRKYYFSYEGKNPIKLICKGSELTEDIAKGLVNIIDFEVSGKFIMQKYSNYKDIRSSYRSTALESFISGVESQGYYWGENPRGETIPMAFEKDTLCRQLWQVAESKTFNPEKTLIFEIL